MVKISYGILLFREVGSEIFVLLAHPGGPLWGKKDFWTIPKGEAKPNEDKISTAKREFSEETGLLAPDSELIDLGEITQSSDKINHIWAARTTSSDTSGFKSNYFPMEWPLHSGQLMQVPEIDKIQWFDLASAEIKLFDKQKQFISRLREALEL